MGCMFRWDILWPALNCLRVCPLLASTPTLLLLLCPGLLICHALSSHTSTFIPTWLKKCKPILILT